MNFFTRGWNRTSSYIGAILFYAVCGILLLLWPDMAMSIANYALAIILCVIGALSIVGYVRGSVLDGVLGIGLTFGLIMLCFGVLLFFSPNLLAALLPSIWGASLLIGGFGKVQMSVDLKRIGDKQWWLTLIGAVISFVLGFFALTKPLFLVSVLFQFIGISLLVEAALDLASFLTINHKIKAFRKTLG